jgi:hypothetical protein
MHFCGVESASEINFTLTNVLILHVLDLFSITLTKIAAPAPTLSSLNRHRQFSVSLHPLTHIRLHIESSPCPPLLLPYSFFVVSKLGSARMHRTRHKSLHALCTKRTSPKSTCTRAPTRSPSLTRLHAGDGQIKLAV